MVQREAAVLQTPAGWLRLQLGGGRNIPQDLESAKKLGSVSKERQNTLTQEIQDQSIGALRLDIKGRYQENLDYYQYRLSNALKNGDIDNIKDMANAVAVNQFILDTAKSTLATKNKERKKFLDSTGRTFSDDQVREYISEHNTALDPQAIVKNTWAYRMGAYGNTTTTIAIGNGKDKPFNGNTPNWRPIGEYSYSVRGWDGKYSTVKGTIQSWDDVRRALSETEDQTFYIYKHPKQ